MRRFTEERMVKVLREANRTSVVRMRLVGDFPSRTQPQTAAEIAVLESVMRRLRG